MNRRPLLSVLTGLGIVVMVLGMAAPASAHVEAKGEVGPGGTTTVTFSFHHGCGQSPTTGLRVQLPANAADVEADNPAGWTSEVKDSVLSWHGGTPIPDRARGEFVATMKLYGNKGETVFFPTIQICADGEEAWIDKSESPSTENAAPRVKIAETAMPPSTGHETTTASTYKPDTTPAPTTTATPGSDTRSSSTTTTSEGTSPTPAASAGSPSTGLVIGIILVVLAIAGGVAALIVRARSSR